MARTLAVVDALGQAHAGIRGRHHRAGDAMAEAIARRLLAQAQREHQHAQQPRHRPDREVAQHAVQRHLDPVDLVVHGPGQQRLVGRRAALVLVALEHRRAHVERRQHVAQARREAFLLLELAAQREHGGVGHQRQRGAVAGQLAVELRGVGAGRRRTEARVHQPEQEGARGVRQREADVAPDERVEGLQAFPCIGQCRGLHFLEHVGMAADRALAEHDHAAGQDVGALDRDRDRRAFPGPAQVVARAQDHALAGVDVHRVLDDLAAQLGGVVLGDRRGHRRLLALVDRVRGHARERADGVGVAAHARQRFLDALEAADRHLELLADAGIGAGGGGRHLDAAGGVGRQRDRAAHRQALDQHAPAVADVLLAADEVAQRHEHVLAAQRAVLERHVERQVAAADLEPGRRARQQRQGNAAVGLRRQQVIRVVQAEGEPDHGRDRRQGDVALVEGQAHAQHLAALVQALAHDAVVRDRGRVGTRVGIGQGEAGDFLAARQPRQVVVLLFLGAVVQQQFGRAQRVGHRDGGAQRARHARSLDQHAVVRVGGKCEPAVLPGDDHAEEAVLLEVFPGLGREVGALVADLPVVDHRAHFLAGPVEEGLLLGAEPGRRHRQQLRPLGPAAEQLAFPAHRAGLERDLLGFRQLRRHLRVQAQGRAAQEAAAHAGEVERQRDRRVDRDRDRVGEPVRARQGHGERQRDARGERPGEQGGAPVRADQADQQQREQGDQVAHLRTPERKRGRRQAVARGNR